MEPLYVFLASSPMLMTMAYFALKTRSCSGSAENNNLPPGSPGWPVLGESIEFLFGNPETFVLKRMTKHSPDIFKTRILGQNTAVICGPCGNKSLIAEDHAEQHPGPSLDEEAALPRLKTPRFLKPEALAENLGLMDETTGRIVREFCEGKKEVRAYSLANKVSMTLACRFFLGADEPELIARLVKGFDDLRVGTRSTVYDFPGSCIFSRAVKAANVVREELKNVIRKEKAADVVMHLVNPSGGEMTEDEKADKMMRFLAEGYSAAAAAMASFMKYVGERPDVYKKILAEQMRVLESKKPGKPLSRDDVNTMKYSWNTVKEVMRLAPPVHGTFRDVFTEFTYAGHTIPKGWKVYWTVSTTNKNPKYFPNPEKFNPSRFDDTGSLIPPFAYVPFGGGPRTCPGNEYARFSILIFVHNLVKRFKWELVLTKENLIPTPKKGLRIRLKPH